MTEYYYSARDILDKAIGTDAYCQIKAILTSIKAADVAEVRHGFWYDCGSLSCRCSECGCKSTLELAQCPACGAIMDLDAGLPDGVVGGDGPAAE